MFWIALYTTSWNDDLVGGSRREETKKEPGICILGVYGGDGKTYEIGQGEKIDGEQSGYNNWKRILGSRHYIAMSTQK